MLTFAGFAGPLAAHVTAHQDGAEHFPWGHPAPAAQADRTIHVKGSDAMRFIPSHITVEKGQTVKFVIENVGKIEHEFVLAPVNAQKEHEAEMQSMMQMKSRCMKRMEDMQDMETMKGMSMKSMHCGEGMHADPNAVEIPPGETRTLTWTFTRAGKLEYGCHEPGHFSAGMVGTITVEKP